MAEAKKASIRNGLFDVQLWSQGSGPPLLYLHGWNGMRQWPAWLDALTGRYHVVAPQHPGYGESMGLEHLADFLDLTLYYLDFIDAMGMERPTIIGHSLGANIAAEMAALSPPSVGKLALVAPTGLWDDKNPVADIYAMTPKQRHALTWHSVEEAEAKGFIPKPETAEEKSAEGLEQARSLAAGAKFLFPIPDRGLKKRVHRIKTPTLLLWGSSDGIVPPTYGPLFKKSIAGSTFVEIPDAGHEPLLEQPERSLEAITRFLWD